MEEKKFCKYCGDKIDKDCIVCPKCGRQIETKAEKLESRNNTEEQKNENIENNINKIKFYEQEWFMWFMLIAFAPVGILFMWKFHPEMKKNTKILITIVFFIFFLIIVYSNSKNNNISNNNNDSNYNDFNILKPSKNTISLDEMFIFDDLEITLGKNISFKKINNKYSNYNGKTVVKVPITIKNLKNETHGLNMFYYSVYGSSGAEAKTLSSYFDDSVDFAGDLRTGASYTKYLYFEYDGDGTYTVEFNKWSTKRIVEFEITK